MALGLRHHLFLQRFLHNPVLPEDQLSPLVKSCCHAEGHATSESVENFLARVKDALGDLDMRIYSVRDFVDGKVYYGLVTTKETEDSNLIEKIFESNGEGFANTVDVLNQNTSDMKKTDIQACLNRMETGKWIKLDKGLIYIGIRSYLELSPYFERNYKDYKCVACTQIAPCHKVCSLCGAKYHPRCISSTPSSMSNEKRNCLSCRKAFVPKDMGNRLEDIYESPIDEAEEVDE